MPITQCLCECAKLWITVTIVLFVQRILHKSITVQIQRDFIPQTVKIVCVSECPFSCISEAFWPFRYNLAWKILKRRECTFSCVSETFWHSFAKHTKINTNKVRVVAVSKDKNTVLWGRTNKNTVLWARAKSLLRKSHSGRLHIHKPTHSENAPSRASQSVFDPLGTI
jgi:hypothetical protein